MEIVPSLNETRKMKKLHGSIWTLRCGNTEFFFSFNFHKEALAIMGRHSSRNSIMLSYLLVFPEVYN